MSEEKRLTVKGYTYPALPVTPEMEQHHARLSAYIQDQWRNAGCQNCSCGNGDSDPIAIVVRARNAGAI